MDSIENKAQRERTKEVLHWIVTTYPILEPTIKYNQPMFTHHSTYIIGCSVAKHHLAVGPEEKAMAQFSDDIKKCGLSQTKYLFKIEWDKPIPFELLDTVIRYNIEDKVNCSTFWRKS
jgi:uncharacterized protein YdhG (YjbR/CyaY superfamily)